MSLSRRVVVTGIGMVTPLGVGASSSYSKITSFQSGIISTNEVPGTSDLEKELYSKIPCKVMGIVPTDELRSDSFNFQKTFPELSERRIARFSQYALVATEEALNDSKWKPSKEDPENEEDLLNTGVCLGSCIGSFADVFDSSLAFVNNGYKKVSPFFVPKYLNNMAAGNVSINYGFKGMVHSVATACATGSNAIGDAYRFIKDGYSDVMVAGATESATHPLALAGFARSKSVTTNFANDPTKASRPFDKDRSGFVLSEGCGILILEELDHALARQAPKIYGEIVGYGLSSDAYHITSPSVGGAGAKKAMQSALRTASLNTDEDLSLVDYINAHATSTKLGDAAENLAIKSIFGDNNKDLVVSSNKGSIGHLLGAAGAVEAAFTLLSVKYGMIPPTLNCENPGDILSSDDFIFNYAANETVKKEIRYAMSNSFGFGGINASLVFKKY